MNRDLRFYFLVIGLPALLLALGGLRLLYVESQRAYTLGRDALKAKATLAAADVRRRIREYMAGIRERAEQLLTEGVAWHAYTYCPVGGRQVGGNGGQTGQDCGRDDNGGGTVGRGKQAVEPRRVALHPFLQRQHEHAFRMVALLDGVYFFYGVGIGGVAAYAPNGVGGVEQCAARGEGAQCLFNDGFGCQHIER